MCELRVPVKMRLIRYLRFLFWTLLSIIWCFLAPWLALCNLVLAGSSRLNSARVKRSLKIVMKTYPALPLRDSTFPQRVPGQSLVRREIPHQRPGQLQQVQVLSPLELLRQRDQSLIQKISACGSTFKELKGPVSIQPTPLLLETAS